MVQLNPAESIMRRKRLFIQRNGRIVTVSARPLREVGQSATAPTLEDDDPVLASLKSARDLAVAILGTEALVRERRASYHDLVALVDRATDAQLIELVQAVPQPLTTYSIWPTIFGGVAGAGLGVLFGQITDSNMMAASEDPEASSYWPGNVPPPKTKRNLTFAGITAGSTALGTLIGHLISPVNEKPLTVEGRAGIVLAARLPQVLRARRINVPDIYSSEWA